MISIKVVIFFHFRITYGYICLINQDIIKDKKQCVNNLSRYIYLDEPQRRFQDDTTENFPQLYIIKYQDIRRRS